MSRLGLHPLSLDLSLSLSLSTPLSTPPSQSASFCFLLTHSPFPLSSGGFSTSEPRLVSINIQNDDTVWNKDDMAEQLQQLLGEQPHHHPPSLHTAGVDDSGCVMRQNRKGFFLISFIRKSVSPIRLCK
ncbi:hypothetical protein BDB00DRAFT_862539 [Zychaea mexicana]|uniref:uncharacterized protein n=1 Tax=Zychaea mexicana TaxID=64656 RepID=UPI0022FECE83|nr:uncharacterized protein BDB00DRAFT_862539 [Zychaea mexicana]KAI9470459.1 hypothetical protein BDB00DRAFT_862539 [Zychaea mexicana]